MIFGIVIILATIMAIFAVVGYLTGTRAALLTTIVIIAGLLLIARAGGTIARLINGLYFGIRFVLAGGVQALAATGDRSAAISQVIQSLGDVSPLVPPDSPGVELFLVLVILVLLSLWVSRYPRLQLRGPHSAGGLFFGLLNGYLLGAHLLTTLLPADAAFLALPFGLSAARAGTQPGGAPAAATGPSFIDQLVANITTASENTLAFIVMAIIALLVVIAIIAGNRGQARSGRNGTR